PAPGLRAAGCFPDHADLYERRFTMAPHNTWHVGPLNVETLEDRTMLSAYTFTDIADTTTGPFTGFSPPAVNAAGAVALAAKLQGGDNTVYKGDGGGLVTIGDAGVAATSPAVNAGGTVVYYFASYTGPSTLETAIVVGDGGPTTKIDYGANKYDSV